MQFLRRIRTAASTPFAGPSAGAHGRPGYDASLERTLERVRPLLASEPVVWLSTVRPGGLPHLVPTWFWWDGEALVVYSKPDAVKVRNLRANPRLMVALGRPEDDFSVGLIEAEAMLGETVISDQFFAKYADRLREAGLDREAFVATYTQAIRIVPTRFLAWRGRAGRHDREPRGVRQPSFPEAPALAFRGTLLPAWA